MENKHVPILPILSIHTIFSSCLTAHPDGYIEKHIILFTDNIAQDCKKCLFTYILEVTLP